MLVALSAGGGVKVKGLPLASLMNVVWVVSPRRLLSAARSILLAPKAALPLTWKFTVTRLPPALLPMGLPLSARRILIYPGVLVVGVTVQPLDVFGTVPKPMSELDTVNKAEL